MEYTNQGYLDAVALIRRVYLEELGRDVLGDPDAVTNWLYHMRENGRDETWLRETFRQSDEYRQRHGEPR